jgi:hypothetical protein
VRLATPTHRDERGVTIVLFALTVVVLLIMASFAVDLGQTYNERHQDQNSADGGVLGGALKLFTTADNPLGAAVTEARDFVDRDLGRSVPAAAWTNCTDSGHLYWTSNDPALGLANGSQCVSFDQGFAKMRVVVPTQQVRMAFASVIGIDSLSSTALAEAGADGAGTVGTLPFSVFGGANAGDETCLKGGTSANSSSDCGGSDNGQFGAFNPYFYTAVNGNPASICTSGDQTQPLARAVADGLDHRLGFFAPYNFGDPERRNGSGCPQRALPALPNTVDRGQGFSSNDITFGFLAGGAWPSNADGFAGRLTRGSYVSSSVSIYGSNIDNSPLWAFITNNANLPGSCVTARAQATSFSPALAPAFKATMKQCLVDWAAPNTNYDQLFVEDLARSPRFASVPKFAEAQSAAGTFFHIVGFVPVFVEAIYSGVPSNGTCTNSVPNAIPPNGGNGVTCIHEPGLATTMAQNNNDNGRLDSVSGLVLGCRMLARDQCQALSSGNPTDPSGMIFTLNLSR